MELSEQVAEKVMGWRRVSDSYRGGMFWVWYAPEGSKHFTNKVDGSEVPAYLSDNNAVQEVVDKLDERGFILMLDNMIHSPLLGKWRATFVHRDFSDYWEDAGWTEYGDTPSLAICLAALKLANNIKART